MRTHFHTVIPFLAVLIFSFVLSGCLGWVQSIPLANGPTPHPQPVFPRPATATAAQPVAQPAAPSPLPAQPAPPAPAHVDQLAIWTFDGGPVFSKGAPIAPTTASSGMPTLTLFDGEIDANGKNGQAYVDSKGISHPADRAAAWDDIKQSDAPDAKIVLKFDTLGWSDLSLRFDYKSESATGYNLESSVDGGASWIPMLIQEGLVADYSWQAEAVDLHSWDIIENQASVWLRIRHLEDTGDAKFVFDNFEITGLKSAVQGQPTMTMEPHATGTQPTTPTEKGEHFHTGMSDASSAVAVDGGVMFVANDELVGGREKIYLFDRNQSGPPLAAFDFTDPLGLTGRELDVEASTRAGHILYWLSSLGNNKDGECRADRQRFFATRLAGGGASATLSYVGRYDSLRDDLIAWDRQNQHGLGADAYGFAASAYCASQGGIWPKRKDGFNVEGLTVAPDQTTGFIAFRAPLVPVPERRRALIVPLLNLTTLVDSNGGGTPGSARFGAPIELDLGGRGIRSIERNAAGEYLIIAGATDNVNDFRLYQWTGNDPRLTSNPADNPVEVVNLTALGGPGSWEGIVEVPTPLAGQVQIVLDNGTTDWYGDHRESKTLPASQQKFRSQWVAW